MSLDPTDARPVADEVVASLADGAARAGVEIVAAGDAELPLRPRMVRVLVAENAVRYAGADAGWDCLTARGGYCADFGDDTVGESARGPGRRCVAVYERG